MSCPVKALFRTVNTKTSEQALARAKQRIKKLGRLTVVCPEHEYRLLLRRNVELFLMWFTCPEKRVVHNWSQVNRDKEVVACFNHLSPGVPKHKLVVVQTEIYPLPNMPEALLSVEESVYNYKQHPPTHNNVVWLPVMWRIPAPPPPLWRPFAERTIDVLFVGSPSPRRSAILQKMIAAGLKVVHPFSPEWQVNGDEIHKYAADAKIYLDIAYAHRQTLATHRLAHMAAQPIVCVSEVFQDVEVQSLLEKAVVFCGSYLVETCVALCSDAARWQKQVAEAQAWWQTTDLPNLLC